MLDKTLSLRAEPVIVLLLIGTAVATGLLAGSYPALFLSSFEPGRVMKGQAHLKALA